MSPQPGFPPCSRSLSPKALGARQHEGARVLLVEVQPRGTAASGPSCQLGDGTAERKASDQHLNTEFTRISHMSHLCPQSRTGDPCTGKPICPETQLCS